MLNEDFPYTKNVYEFAKYMHFELEVNKLKLNTELQMFIWRRQNTNITNDQLTIKETMS